MSSARLRAELAVGATAFVLATAVGCTARGANTPLPDPEHQSIAEFNLGLDAVNHGDFRVALAHALRAVEFDDKNARAPTSSPSSTSASATACGASRIRTASWPMPRGTPAGRSSSPRPTRTRRTLLGEVLIDEKRYPEAIEVLRPLTTDPSYTSIHLAWGTSGGPRCCRATWTGGSRPSRTP